MSTPGRFRFLNDNEKSCVLAAAKKGRIKATHPLVADIDRATISYEQMQGGFCVCIISLAKSVLMPELGSLIYRGASRRSYKDARNPIKGEMLAFSRAVLYSRPVELV